MIFRSRKVLRSPLPEIESELARYAAAVPDQRALNALLQTTYRAYRAALLEKIRPHLQFEPLDLSVDVPWVFS